MKLCCCKCTSKEMNLLAIKQGETERVVCSDINGGEYHVTDFTPQEYDDKVIINGDVYKEIFGSPRYTSTRRRRLLSVVKITTPDGQSIHRAFYGRKGVEGLDYNQIALSPNSIRLLTDKNGKSQPEYIHEVVVSRGSRFLYFWNHPYHATRISMRLGVWGIVVSLLFSFLFSFLFSCC